VITESRHITHCDSMKEYSSDCGKTVDTIQSMRSKSSTT
jgi:hypothetical protein